MFLNHKNNHKHPFKNPNFNRPANRQRNTSGTLSRWRNGSGITGYIPQQPNPQRQTIYMMPHRQHESVENPGSYSSLLWKLSTKTLEDSQTILTQNTTAMAQRFPRVPTYNPSERQVTADKATNREEDASEQKRTKKKKRMETIFRESKLRYYWEARIQR